MQNKNIISSNKTIFKNTITLYVRQILALAVGLYTVRVVLSVLGAEDYGVYSVIAGIVLFFSFLKDSMALATQRFFSFAIGKNNDTNLKEIFSVNLCIYFLIGIISLILLEFAGLWFVEEHLKLPVDRIEVAHTIYHYIVLTFFFTIFSTPFISIIIAHEDMRIYAYLSILEVVLKLCAVFLLIYLDGDKLILYSQLLFVISIVLVLIYSYTCVKRYNECQFLQFYWNLKLFKEIIGFTWWTLYGQFTTATRNQAITVLINQYYNPVIVAATVISKSISSQIQVFSVSFNSSLYPPIIKSYALDDKKSMFSLIFNGSRITFFLMWILALPFLLEMENIMQVWLKEVPTGTILFTRLAIVELLINSISMPIQTAARAPGRMKNYELILGTFQISIFLISWLMLYQGYEAYVVFLIAIIVNIIMFLVRLIIVRKLIALPLKLFFLKVILPIVLIVITSATASFIFRYYFNGENLFYSLITILMSVFIVLVTVYFLGLDKEWKLKLKNMIFKKIRM